MGYYCTRCKKGSRRDTILHVMFLLLRRLHLLLCHVMKAFCIRVLKSISKKIEVIHYIGSDLDRCLFILNIEYIECRNIKKKEQILWMTLKLTIKCAEKKICFTCFYSFFFIVSCYYVHYVYSRQSPVIYDTSSGGHLLNDL